MHHEHGGNIYKYSNNNLIDFSANINPYGIPSNVKQAMHDAIDLCIHYPEPNADRLKHALAEKYNLKPENFFCSNGAAEIFYRLVNVIKPKSAIITAPTFSEYEQALLSVNCEIKHHFLLKENDFSLTNSILSDLDDNIDICILCNPNNPTGKTINTNLMNKIIKKCDENSIYLIIDECFLDFIYNEKELSVLNNKSNNLIIVKAFTKMYALAGVRLGFCISHNVDLINKLSYFGQPWNTSVIAQQAGLAALKLTDYPRKIAQNIKVLRDILYLELKKLNLTVFYGEANYLLFYTFDFKLHEKLLKYNILIRNCENYIGLNKGYYRVAVRTEEENNKLIKAIKEVLKN